MALLPTMLITDSMNVPGHLQDALKRLDIALESHNVLAALDMATSTIRPGDKPLGWFLLSQLD